MGSHCLRVHVHGISQKKTTSKSLDLLKFGKYANEKKTSTMWNEKCLKVKEEIKKLKIRYRRHLKTLNLINEIDVNFY